jgi:SAM-dependent methyltransferase
MIQNRDDFPAFLNNLQLTNQWAELGVAKGAFSEHLLKYGKCNCLWSIDRWAGDRGHDNTEAELVRKRLAPFQYRSRVMQTTFQRASHQFQDEFFDFIYIDGYAHTGQDAGQTLREWWPLLRKGGIFAGHDYHQNWPLTVTEVDAFVLEKDLHLSVTLEQWKKGSNIFPSWWVRK